MLDCWQEDPCSRPTFTALHQQLDVIIEDHSTASYINFDLTVNGTTCDSDTDSDSEKKETGDSWMLTTGPCGSGQLDDGGIVAKTVTKASSVPQFFGRHGECSEFLSASMYAQSSDHLLAPLDSPNSQSSRLLPP